MKTGVVYDRIGAGYSRYRRTDARIADAIAERLGLAAGATIADVGAGCGNYARAFAERGLRVKAVEPSEVMRRQAVDHSRVEWVAGMAEAVPLPDNSVAGVVSVLAFHHFASPGRAAIEMARISAGPIVVFTHDPRTSERFWLEDYFPELFEGARHLFPPIRSICRLFEALGLRSTVEAFPLPGDLEDLFLAAGWRRPEIYLDPTIRACMSAFALTDPEWVELRIDRMRRDLDSGVWHERHRAILKRREFNAGYLLVRARRE